MVRVEVYVDQAGEQVEMFARRYGRGTAYVVRQAGVPDRFLTAPEAIRRARRDLHALGFDRADQRPAPGLAWLSRLARLPFRLRPA